jgi:hypothetical protein
MRPVEDPVLLQQQSWQHAARQEEADWLTYAKALCDQLGSGNSPSDASA